MASPSTSRDLLVGLTFSCYRIAEKLGGGVTGLVYEAENSRFHRFVAVKFHSAEIADHQHWPVLNMFTITNAIDRRDLVPQYALGWEWR